MGRCIYGGIYDPGNPLSDPKTGWRLDIMSALRDIAVPVVRYPGGNFVATYHWLDGVGPVSQRPKRPELAWLGTEPNTFGTDEFLAWCEALGTAPYLALNFGTGTLDEALAWVEYCNGAGDTYYANMRRRNGRHAPWNVKFWALGNEMWGPWQVGQMTSSAYAERAFQWGKALKLLDPSLCLILCGKEGATSWDFEVLKKCVLPLVSPLATSTVPVVDMHSIHLYTASQAHAANVVAPRAAERSIEITAALIDLAFIENGCAVTQVKPSICFDEWNVWDPLRAVGSEGAEERYTLSDALAVGVWLNVFVRQAGVVGMANIAQSVNVISPLMTTETGIVRQTTWWPLWLFCKYMRGETIAVHVSGEEYDGVTQPLWLRGVGRTPWLDVSGSVDGEGWVSVCVVNGHEAKAFEVDFAGAKGEVQVFIVTGEDPTVTNMDGVENVCVKETKWDGKGRFSFGKHSMTMLRWKA